MLKKYSLYCAIGWCSGLNFYKLNNFSPDSNTINSSAVTHTTTNAILVWCSVESKTHRNQIPDLWCCINSRPFKFKLIRSLQVNTVILLNFLIYLSLKKRITKITCFEKVSNFVTSFCNRTARKWEAKKENKKPKVKGVPIYKLVN